MDDALPEFGHGNAATPAGANDGAGRGVPLPPWKSRKGLTCADTLMAHTKIIEGSYCY